MEAASRAVERRAHARPARTGRVRRCGRGRRQQLRRRPLQQPRARSALGRVPPLRARRSRLRRPRRGAAAAAPAPPRPRPRRRLRRARVRRHVRLPLLGAAGRARRDRRRRDGGRAAADPAARRRPRPRAADRPRARRRARRARRDDADLLPVRHRRLPLAVVRAPDRGRPLRVRVGDRLEADRAAAPRDDERDRDDGRRSGAAGRRGRGRGDVRPAYRAARPSSPSSTSSPRRSRCSWPCSTSCSAGRPRRPRTSSC